MPRKIAIRTPEGPRVVVSEVPADSEFQLQEFLKDNPEMLPVEELRLPEPLMVVGRESSVSSGGIDLIGVVRTGEVLIIEFKTGLQNTDFRSALAQLSIMGPKYVKHRMKTSRRDWQSDSSRAPDAQTSE
jgi:RecB family endonuclease NucS